MRNLNSSLQLKDGTNINAPAKVANPEILNILLPTSNEWLFERLGGG
ncbi:hypothetical protein M8998_06105 [Sphingobacterium sp. lm-10]|nr:hypothetical protein [Sphingobacterium sp. lm-10]MCL7987505.1 hypothetical protein [Sphingobacterium sp. lm-10]